VKTFPTPVARLADGQRRAARIALATLAALAAAGLLAGASKDREDRLHLERLDAAVRDQIDLAKAETAYLVLDLEQRRLELVHGAAVLRVYPVLRAEIGTPRVGFFDREPGEWGQGRHDTAAMVPERTIRRVEIAPPPADESEARATADEAAADGEVEIPPTPEEACPAPSRYLLRYGDGFAIEVRSDSADPRGTWALVGNSVRMKLAAMRAALFGGHPRVRVTLAAEDAGALYRSFPTGSGLVVR